MKECKCGKMPPCYGSLERAIYEEAKKVNDEWKKSRARHDKLIDKMRNKLMEGGFLDDTHEKVYGLNRQMCDIDRHLSEAGYFGMICDGQIEARKKLIDMEEKKTKKMTKAEAFEHLKGTKVLCKDYDKMEAVQDFVRSLGFYWGDASEEMVLTHTLFLHKDGRLSFALSLQYFREQKSPELSADDILSIEIVDENKSEEEKALDKISCLGAQIVDILLRMKGHHHVIITETSVALYDEGMCLFHSDPF